MNLRSSLPAVLLAATALLGCTSTTKTISGGTGGSDAGVDGKAGKGAGGASGGSAGSSSGGSTGSGGAGGSSAASGSGGAGGSGGVSGSSGSAGAAGAAAADGAAGAAGTDGCASTEGPALVPVDGFCIDSTEVSAEQYERFVNAKQGDTSGQIATCTGNTSYVPSDGWPPATDSLDNPVNYVDWCDAYAYCKWAGKRLCGKIGGGANAYIDFADATKSQWYDVCSNGGRNAYPYGGTFDPQACNGYDGPNGCNGGTCTLSDVGSYPSCQGAGEYAGVFDLSGNVLEWEDSCAADPDGGEDYCSLRGGAIYAQHESSMACDDEYSAGRSSTAPGTGFRCCRD